MLFLPFRDLIDLRDEGENSYWTKFHSFFEGTKHTGPSSAVFLPSQALMKVTMAVTGLRKKKEAGVADAVFWTKGKEILQNIQNRTTIEKKLKQPHDPLQIQTKTPKSTGARAHSDKVDDNDSFDVDIDGFDIGQSGDNQGQEFAALDP